MVLKLPSDPSSGNRWNLRESSDELLKKLGPEVYSNSEQDPLGGKGTSTWRFQATHPGTGRLLLTYQRPWEVGAEPSGLFDCRIVVK